MFSNYVFMVFIIIIICIDITLYLLPFVNDAHSAQAPGQPIPIPKFIVQMASGPYTNNKIHTNTA